MKRLASILSQFLPPYNTNLYQLCRRYVDRYNGENNDNIHTNGELRFMRQILGNCQTVFPSSSGHCRTPYIYKIYPHGLRRVERYDQRLENFQYQNWAIMRAE